MFLGDVTCQQIEQHSSSATSPPTAEATTPIATENDYYLHLGFAATTWNVSRSVRMGCTGLLLSGPISHVTYVAVARSSIQSVYMKTLAIVAVAVPSAGAVDADCERDVDVEFVEFVPVVAAVADVATIAVRKLD